MNDEKESYTYGLTIELNATGIHSDGHALLVGECGEGKTLTSPSLSIEHDSCVVDFSKLMQEDFEGFRGDTWG